MNKNNSKSGQSTVEFILTLALVAGFSLFFVQTAFIFAYGNYVHYSTFMSARAYLSSGYDESDQLIRARIVLCRMLKKSEDDCTSDKWPGMGTGVDSENSDEEVRGASIGFFGEDIQNKIYSWQEGVRYKFKSRVFSVPFIGNGVLKPVELVSESWLGRHESYVDCLNDFFEKNIKGYVIDNGC